MPGEVKRAADQDCQAMLPSLDTAYPTLILKASRGVIHHGALAVARTLGRLGVQIFAVVDDGYSPLAMSRYVTSTFVWESWPGDPASFRKEMATIAEVIDHPSIIIPMDDMSAVFVAENAASLARWFLLPQVPPQLPRQLANKASLYALCAKIGIPSVPSVVPHSIDDVRAFAHGTAFPVVVKTAEQWLLLHDRYSTKVIQTPGELFEFYEKINCAEYSRTILQEYIAGDDWISHGYYNTENNIYVTFTGRKLRAYPADAGSTALGVSLGNETLRCQSERFLKAVAYSGITDMDWRKDERDGQYKILDCNPRVGQNFRMFENSAAIDVVRAQHLDLTGRLVDCAPMIDGRLFTVESFCLQAILRQPHGRTLKPSSGIALRLISRELAWWSSDDPLPFFMMSVRLFIRALGRAFRHISGRP
jgi:D-aspartate ligase